MRRIKQPPAPVHLKGSIKGEETVIHKGREPGRGGQRQYRTARDSTGINPGTHGPILPIMPSIPPA